MYVRQIFAQHFRLVVRIGLDSGGKSRYGVSLQSIARDSILKSFNRRSPRPTEGIKYHVIIGNVESLGVLSYEVRRIPEHKLIPVVNCQIVRLDSISFSVRKYLSVGHACYLSSF